MLQKYETPYSFTKIPTDLTGNISPLFNPLLRQNYLLFIFNPILIIITIK